jgi:hypothetical protein
VRRRGGGEEEEKERQKVHVNIGPQLVHTPMISYLYAFNPMISYLYTFQTRFVL